MIRLKFLLKYLVLCMAALLGATAAKAQSTTQGGISATVEDDSGAIVPDAAVTVHNNGTNAEEHLKADSSGFFKVPLLEPGSYTVTIFAKGFSEYKAANVTVQVGVLTSLEPRLKAGSTDTVVQVTADEPVLNFDSPDIASVLPRKAIDDVPIQIRRWSALALTTPAVIADSSGFGLISVRAISTLLNNVEIDGADDNQAYYSEERGRTRAQYTTSPNEVQEFQVNTGVYSSQYGRAAGAVINSVTRSGSNKLHGELLFTDLDRGFGGFIPGLSNLNSQPLKLKDIKKIYGGTIGGALIKDKLFWQYTFDQSTHINQGYAKPNSVGAANGSTIGSFLEQPDTTLIGSCNTTTGVLSSTGNAHQTLDGQVCLLAAREGLPYYSTTGNSGVAAYDNGLGFGPYGSPALEANGLSSDLGVVPRVGYQEINSPKLDWQINPKERVSFLYNRTRWDGPGYVQTSAGPLLYARDAYGTDYVKTDWGVAKLTSLINNSMSNELLYQYGRELDDEGQQPYTSYTLDNLVAPGGGAILGGLSNAPGGGTIPYINLNTSIGFNLGSPYYSYRQALPDERKWQIGDTLYFTFGNHSLKIGGDVLHNTDLTKQEPYYFGDYSYGSTVNYLSDLYSKQVKGGVGTCSTSAGTGVGTTDCYNYAYQDFGATSFSIATTDYSGFVQDNWKIKPNLTLELGVRYDIELLPAPSATLTAPATNFVPYAALQNHPKDANNIGPRIGFSYDPYGTGKMVIRGGYGIFYGRINNGLLLNVWDGTGSSLGQFQLARTTPNTPGAPTFPNPFSAGSGAKPSSYYLAPNLQNPDVQQFDLTVQQELGKGTALQISYLGALGRNLPNFINTNLAPPQDTATITVGSPAVSGFGNGPLPINAKYTVPTFGTCTAGPTCPYPTGYINPNFTNITEVLSNINSNYNGMVVELQNRGIHGLVFDANYTWSHALDYNQNAQSTVITDTWLNPYNARQNYGVSQFNVGNRFTGYALYTIPGVSSGGWIKYLANGWTINDSFSMQNGLPYSGTISTSGTGKGLAAALNSGTWNGINSYTGGGGNNYIPVIGLNTYQVPRAIVDDLRLQKAFLFNSNHGNYTLQLIADMYNVANHENYTTSDINTAEYSFLTTGTLSYVPNNAPGVGFQSHTTANDSGFLYTPREFQLGARLEF
jgi:hypothetical protein